MKSRGEFQAFEVGPEGRRLLSCHPNQTQVQWGFLAAKLFGQGDADYRLRAFYVEFENVASPGDPVAVPDSIPYDEGREYYAALSGSRDYLRVPIAGLASIDAGTGYEEFFPDEELGNRISLHAVTSGSSGVNGLEFSDSANSTVCGLAIVAAPVWADPTQDVVFARSYYEADEQIPKSAGRQLGFSWKHVFDLPEAL